MQLLPPLSPPLGPFVAGLNQVQDPRLLPPNVAVTAINCELRSGALRPIASPGTKQTLALAAPSLPTGGTADNGFQWMFLANTYPVWVAAKQPQHGCLDTLSMGYVTDILASGTVKEPRILAGGNSRPMGVIAPTSLALASNGTSGGPASYAVTFTTLDGLESNPYPVLSATPIGCTLNVGSVWTLPLGVVSRVSTRKIYRTDINDTTGNLYLIATVADNTSTSFTDTGYPLVATVRLKWSPGGAITDDVLTYDHSPWGPALVISDYIHGANPGVANVGVGIFFATDSTGYTVIWSPSGSPQYCPTDVQNRQAVPEQVQALRTHGYQTLAFMPNSIWSFSGVADYSMNRARTDAERGVRMGCGQTVRRCPWGVLFLAKEGVALYSNNAAPVITLGVLDPACLAGLTINGASFYNGVYFLFHTTGTILLDMRDYPGQLRVLTSDQVIRCGWVNPYSLIDTSYDPGLFVALDSEQPAFGGTGYVREWSLTEALAGAAPLAVTWTTPPLTWGQPTRLKQWTKLRLQGTGTVTIQIFRDDEAAPRVNRVVVLDTTPFIWLGRGFRARSLKITVTSTAGQAFTLLRLEPEGGLCDGP
jgi:hypothetical protein